MRRATRLITSLWLTVTAVALAPCRVGHCLPSAAPGADVTPPPPPAFGEVHLPDDVPTLRGNAPWVPLLMAGLGNTDPGVRARSAFLLGLVGESRAVRPLSDALRDPIRDVRVHAGIALGMLGDARGLPTCTAVLADADEWVRFYALEALARIAFASSSQVMVHGPKAEARAQTEFERSSSGKAFAALRSAAGSNDSKYARDWATAALERVSLKTTALQPDRVRPTGGDVSPNRQGDLGARSLDAIFDSAADVLIGLSDFPWHLGSYPDAIRLNQAVTFLIPDYPDAYESAAWLLWSDDRPDEGMRWRLKGLRANPGVFDMYFDIGFWYLQRKEYPRAVRYLTKAASFPCPEYVMRSLAHALEGAGRPADALAVWEKLLNESPENGVARQNADRIRAAMQG